MRFCNIRGLLYLPANSSAVRMLSSSGILTHVTGTFLSKDIFTTPGAGDDAPRDVALDVRLIFATATLWVVSYNSRTLSSCLKPDPHLSLLREME